MKERERHVVIMAGGVGSRIWPLSTTEMPKQFIDVLGIGKSLLQLTVDRFRNLCPIENFWIVTNEKYVEIIKEQLPSLLEHQILTEPESRNTAPCIAYACWKIKHKSPNANIVLTPSDAFVTDKSVFADQLSKAFNFTNDNQTIVTVGIKPTRPETGFGYICNEENVENKEFIKVISFKEKPCIEKAKEYIQKSNYLWNSGIFVANINTLEKAFRKFTPKLANKMDEMSVDFYTNKEKITVARVFPSCEKISFDYSIMEHFEPIYTIRAEFEWSDLGTWGALHSILPKDSQNNACIGDKVTLSNCKGCIVHLNSPTEIIIDGLVDYIIAEKNGKILISRISQEQDIKNLLIPKTHN